MVIFGAIMMLTPLLPTFRHFRCAACSAHDVLCPNLMCTWRLVVLESVVCLMMEALSSALRSRLQATSS